MFKATHQKENLTNRFGWRISNRILPLPFNFPLNCLRIYIYFLLVARHGNENNTLVAFCFRHAQSTEMIPCMSKWVVRPGRHSWLVETSVAFASWLHPLCRSSFSFQHAPHTTTLCLLLLRLIDIYELTWIIPPISRCQGTGPNFCPELTDTHKK